MHYPENYDYKLQFFTLNFVNFLTKIVCLKNKNPTRPLRVDVLVLW